MECALSTCQHVGPFKILLGFSGLRLLGCGKCPMQPFLRSQEDILTLRCVGVRVLMIATPGVVHGRVGSASLFGIQFPRPCPGPPSAVSASVHLPCVSDAHSNLRTTTFRNLLHPGLSHIVFHRKQASWTPGVVPGVQETWGKLHTSIPLEGVECMLVSGEALCLPRRVPNTVGLGRCFSKGN